MGFIPPVSVAYLVLFTPRAPVPAAPRDATGSATPKSPRKAWGESILGRGTCDALATFWTQTAAAAPPPAAPSLASRPSGFFPSMNCGKGGRGRRPSRRIPLVESLKSRHNPPLRSSMDDDEGCSLKIELIRGFGQQLPVRHVGQIFRDADVGCSQVQQVSLIVRVNAETLKPLP